MNRTALRMLTTLAAMAVATSSPAVVGIATADDRPVDTRTWGLTVELRSDSELVAAVKAARDDYRTTVLAARSLYRTTLEGARLAVMAAPLAQRPAVRTQYQGQIDTAMASAKSALVTARSLYQTSLASAFASHAAGTSIPRSLQEPSWWLGLSDGTWLASDPTRP